MKKYIHYMRNERTPHERRQAALQIASMVTAVLAVGWVATLGVRLATNPGAIAGDENTVQLVANVESGLEAVQSGWNNAPYYQPSQTNQ